MKTQNRKEIFLKALANGEEPNIKPLTRQEVLLKKQAERESAGGGGGGGDCDWNLMKNKPFEKKVLSTTEILPLQTVSLTYNGGQGVSMGTIALSAELVSDKAYKVTFNGVEYEYIAELQPNGAVSLGDKGCNPFLIMSMGSNQIIGLAGNHSECEIAISMEETEITQLHEMFLPAASEEQKGISRFGNGWGKMVQVVDTSVTNSTYADVKKVLDKKLSTKSVIWTINDDLVLWHSGNIDSEDGLVAYIRGINTYNMVRIKGNAETNEITMTREHNKDIYVWDEKNQAYKLSASTTGEIILTKAGL